MQCQRCAAENPEGAAFCQACGTRLEIVCAACGRGSNPGARFCGWCGGSLTPDALVVEPGGERKQATVLFADIVGSTEMIAGMDAEAAMDRLQPVVAAMARAVRRYDGTILRTLGDGLKAAFGAPVAREGHALLAAQAALAMRDAVAALPGAPPIRIGLHSGEVVAGALNTGPMVEMEAQGMTVHLASRIEQLAVRDEICMSGDCRTLVGPYCETQSRGAFNLRGIAAPVEVYRLDGMRPAVASDQFRGTELAPMRGRDREMAILRRALEEAENGKPSIVGISAPAGVGKSRLCFEFSEWCRGRRVDVVEGRAHVYGQATPLLPVLEILRTFLRIGGLTDPASTRERIRQRIMGLDPALIGDLPALLDFLGYAPPGQALPRMEPRARLARLTDIVRAMVKAAGRRPSVLIVEDLHWLDEASGDFMQTLAEAIQGTHHVVVLNFRPTWSAPLMAMPHYRELRLEELPAAHARDLVRDHVGDDGELATIVDKVAQQCGGNPFFAEQLILSLAQDGVLSGERGHYRLTGPVSADMTLPATVEAVLGDRLDRLDAREKGLLQIGAIIGKEFPQALIEEVAGITTVDARRLLDRLTAAELILPRSGSSGASFAFRHPLIQEVAYATQLRARRVRLHAAVARAMERHEWGMGDESAGLLSHHCEAAGELELAARHLARAARWVGRTNSAQAFADWKKVRHLLRDQPRSDENDKLRALANGQILNFGWREGISAEEAKPFAEEALRFARGSSDRSHEPLLLGAYGRILSASGAADDYVRLVGDAIALSGPDGDPGRRGTVHGMLCQAYWQSGRLNEALTANDTALAAFESRNRNDGQVVLGLDIDQVLGFDVEHWVKCLRTRVLVWLGRHDEAEIWIARVSQVATDVVNPVVQFIPHFAAVELAWHRDDAVSADRHATIVAEYADRSVAPYLQAMSQACRGLASIAAADFARAETCLTDALSNARHAKAGLELEARLLAPLADTHLRAGDAARAAKVAAEAMDVARRRTDRLAECHAGVVAVRAGGESDAALVARTRLLANETGASLLQSVLSGSSFATPLNRQT